MSTINFIEAMHTSEETPREQIKIRTQCFGSQIKKQNTKIKFYTGDEAHLKKCLTDQNIKQRVLNK